jgi:hypothetical protein
VFETFKKFKAMVEKTNIWGFKLLRIDQGGKYESNHLVIFATNKAFEDKPMLHTHCNRMV